MAENLRIGFRRARSQASFDLMKLYQRATRVPLDPVLLNLRKLQVALESDDQLWIVAAPEEGGEPVGLLSLLVDTENRLGQITRFCIDPQWPGVDTLLHGAMPLLVHYLETKGVEVIFMNTRFLSDEQQQLAADVGFHVLGVFPGSVGTRVNALFAYFLRPIAVDAASPVRLHPSLIPFYDLVRKSCGLPEALEAEVPPLPTVGLESFPELEVLHAPKFALARFERLLSRKSLATHFYPFQQPNAIITDPSQGIEIFLRMIPEKKAAAIIGERLERPVNPAHLYDQVACMLNSRNITYVEIINDASDTFGIECLLRAGFLPSAYFPGFKNQGDVRRDYAILTRSFERLSLTAPSTRPVHQTYLAFLKRYARAEARMLLSSPLKDPT